MRYILLIKNNLKRSVITAITLVFLVSVAMCAILVSMNSLMQMEKTVEDVKDKTNCADVSIMMPKATHEEAVEDILSDVDSIKETEKEDVYYFGDGSISNENLDDNGDELPILIERISFKRKMSKVHTLEESSTKHDNGIYLPYYL